jgi:large repetitive protein
MPAGPSITLPLTPGTGPVSGFTSVQIDGSFPLHASTTVTFGGQAAVVTAHSPTQLTVTLPPYIPVGQIFGVNVTVTDANGSDTKVGAFTYYNAPSVNLPIIPNSGSTAGGDLITFNGFFPDSANIQVAITPNQVLGTIVTRAFDRMIVSMPAHAAGVANITFWDNWGQSCTIAGQYTYAVPTAPAIEPDNTDEEVDSADEGSEVEQNDDSDADTE